jgi:hypothetical protein
MADGDRTGADSQLFLSPHLKHFVDYPATLIHAVPSLSPLYVWGWGACVGGRLDYYPLTVPSCPERYLLVQTLAEEGWSE